MDFELNPTLPQDDLVFSEAQFPAFVGGYGSGKTEALLGRALVKVVSHPENSFGHYLPTYDLVRQVAFERWEEMLTRLHVPYKLVKSPSNEIRIEGHGRIIFRSMDMPSRIVGYEVADSFVDELDILDANKAEDVWGKIVARNRQKKTDASLNSVAVATTPEGFRFVYKKWVVERAAKLKGYEQYQLITAPTYSNPYLAEGYVDSLRGNHPEHLLNAYIEGEFVNMTTGSIYIAFDRETHHTDTTIEGNEPLYIGMDFNVGQMSAVTHVKRDKKPKAVDEIVGVLDTPNMISVIRNRYGYDRSILIYPDASGQSRDTTNASTSDIALLKAAGFRVLAKKKNPFVRDRINSMNAAFEKGGYEINTMKCPIYTSCIEQQSYDKTGSPDKKQGLDHLPDAGGYFIIYEYPLIKPIFSTNIGMAI